MARLTKEISLAIDKEINKHNDIFETLKNCGGVLYLEDFAAILDKPSSTLKYQIKNSLELELLEVLKSPVGKTKKDVIRLTDRCWRKLGINRDKVSVQEETIDRCLYRAILNKNLDFNSRKEELLNDLRVEDLKYSIIDRNNEFYNLKSIAENLHKIEESNKLLIKDYCLDVENKKVYLDFYYVNRKLRKSDLRELNEFIDISVGLFEWYCFYRDKDFFRSDNYIKMNLTVVTEDSYNTKDKLKDIKKHIRNYHPFSKQTFRAKTELFYSIAFIFDNNINFMKIDKDMYSLVRI